MLVGDIYGGDYNKIGLKATTIASSFGKVIKTPPEERKKKFKQQDIARSLLYLVRLDLLDFFLFNRLCTPSNNIGQIAYLNAQAHGITRIYFSGFYISGHTITMNTLRYRIDNLLLALISCSAYLVMPFPFGVKGKSRPTF